ncbi:hypothetical protein TNCV_558771 [Trichonephila clavipes]|nr:hypothetical protein TNCV_558771 [Trichonephila clavipes]
MGCVSSSHSIYLELRGDLDGYLETLLQESMCYVSREESRLLERSTPVVGLGIEHHTGDSTNLLGEIPQKDDRWRHYLSPPPQFWHGTGGEGNILQSPARVIKPKKLRIHWFNEHVLRVYWEGIWWHRASNPGLPVWIPML